MISKSFPVLMVNGLCADFWASSANYEVQEYRGGHKKSQQYRVWPNSCGVHKESGQSINARFGPAVRNRLVSSGGLERGLGFCFLGGERGV